MRAVVIGSGIGGLAATLALRRVGVDAALHERAPALTEVGAGISLWANALSALDAFGAGDAVRAVALRMARSEFRTDRGHRVAVSFRAEPFEAELGSSPFVALCHRAELVAALAELLPPGAARYGRECVRVELLGDRVAAHFADGTSEEGDVLVGADGLRSAVRRELFGLPEPRYAGHTCWRGVCPRPTSVEAGYCGEWWGRGRRFGITTMPGDRVYWFAAKNAPAGGKSPPERDAALAAFAGWADPVEELIATTPAERVLRNDIVDRPPARPWSKGRAVLLGDAAHPTTPNFGQGGCMAIEDAAALARHLVGPGTVEARLAAFERERYARTSAITRESWRFGSVAQWEGALACRLRDGLVRAVMPLMGRQVLAKYAKYKAEGLPKT